MTSIAALGVQTMNRPAAAHAAALTAATPAREGEAEGRVSARDPAPAIPLLAEASLSALVAVQAQQNGPAPTPSAAEPTPVFADLAAAARAITGVERALADGRVADAQRSAFAAAAAERRAAAIVAHGHPAPVILHAVQAEFRGYAIGRCL